MKVQGCGHCPSFALFAEYAGGIALYALGCMSVLYICTYLTTASSTIRYISDRTRDTKSYFGGAAPITCLRTYHII